MALSTKLYFYLALERIMLDNQGRPVSERVRDRMDKLWYELTEEEHKFLDSRVEAPE